MPALPAGPGRPANPFEARDLFAALLDDDLRVLGPDHPETLIARASLAGWTGQAGKPVEARDLFASCCTTTCGCSAPTTQTP